MQVDNEFDLNQNIISYCGCCEKQTEQRIELQESTIKKLLNKLESITPKK